MTRVQRIKYRLACWLMGFDIYGANAVARQQGYRQGFADGRAVINRREGN